MDTSTVISIAALITSILAAIANHHYMRVQLAFSNFPVLQIIEAKTHKISRRDDKNKDLLLNGTCLQFAIVNRSKDISAIDVSFRVFISKRRKTNKLLNLFYSLRRSEFYGYAWDFIEPGKEVKTFQKDFFKEPTLESWLNTFMKSKAMKSMASNAEHQENHGDSINLNFIAFIEMKYKSNRYQSKTLKVKDKFLLNYRYDNGWAWEIIR
jgi:hypothetical protein